MHACENLLPYLHTEMQSLKALEYGYLGYFNKLLRDKSIGYWLIDCCECGWSWWSSG